MFVPEMTNCHFFFASPNTFVSLFYLSLSFSSAHYNHSLSFSRHGSSGLFVPPSHRRRSSLPFSFFPPFFLPLAVSLIFHPLSLSHSFTPFSPGKEGQLWPCVSWGVPSDSDQWGVPLSSFTQVTIGPWNASVSVSNPHSAPQCPCVYNGWHNLVIWIARSQ